MISVKLTGDKELQALLDELPDKVQKVVVKKALKESAEIVKSEMVAHTPVALDRSVSSKGVVRYTKAKGKHLRDSIKIKMRTGKRHKIGVIVGAPGRFHQAMALEYGTSKMKPQPFMRQSLNSKEGQIISLFATLLRYHIQSVSS